MPDLYERDRYDAELRARIAAIFSGVSISNSAWNELRRLFTHSDWLVVRLPGDIFRAPTERNPAPADADEAECEDAWVSFFETLRGIGEHDLFIAARPDSLEPPARPAADAAAACSDFTRHELNLATWNGSFMVYEETLVFGRQPVWGMVTHWESFTILGGAPDFIRRYADAAGGFEAVRRRFEDHIDWQLRNANPENVSTPFADRIVRSIRWPS